MSDETEDEFEETLHGERFVRVCEWMRQRGLAAPLPLPCLITAALWQRLERIPFRILHSTTLEDRVLHLVARTRACLEAYNVAQVCTEREQLTLAFSASLPCRAEDPTRQIVHLRCGPGGSLGTAIVLGLPADLPLERTASGYSVAPSTRTVQGQGRELAPQAARSTQNWFLGAAGSSWTATRSPAQISSRVTASMLSTVRSR